MRLRRSEWYGFIVHDARAHTVPARSRAGSQPSRLKAWQSRPGTALEAHQEIGDEPQIAGDEIGAPAQRHRGRDVTIRRGDAAVTGEVGHAGRSPVELEAVCDVVVRH